jgi:hypothetical protein
MLDIVPHSARYNIPSASISCPQQGTDAQGNSLALLIGVMPAKSLPSRKRGRDSRAGPAFAGMTALPRCQSNESVLSAPGIILAA